MPDLNARIDADRLDWLGEPGYTKSRMDNVISLMRGRDIREAVDLARGDERCERTPLDRLEAWERRRKNHEATIFSAKDKPPSQRWTVELYRSREYYAHGYGRTLDAAIAAALAQAEGKR